MTVLTASQIYQLSLQQIASESFLDWSLPGYSVPGEKISLNDVLRLGSNNPGYPLNIAAQANLPGKTRMTDQQIVDFNANYLIVAHQANTASGFSGTLLKNKITGDYTLSFRSTEFADDSNGGDWSRDGVSGADGEMASHGFALGQIADMEAWFIKLKLDWLSDPTRGLPPGGHYNVTGYSLGGHLATVFTEANKDDPNLIHTYLFNAPGRGGLSNGVTMAQFVSDVYSRMKAAGLTLLDGIGQTSGSRQDVYNGATLMQAYASVRQDILNAWHPSAASLLSGSPGAIEANSLITNIVGTTDYGDITLSAKVGNGTSDLQKTFIEDQPLIEGLAFGFTNKFSVLFAGMGRSDFGNTHAITLIADAARVAALLQKLDPSLFDADAAAILSAPSNESGIASPRASRRAIRSRTPSRHWRGCSARCLAPASSSSDFKFTNFLIETQTSRTLPSDGEARGGIQLAMESRWIN